MLRTMMLSAVLAGGCTAAHGETFVGRLLDAWCATPRANGFCTPDDTTTAFALQIPGKLLKLDAEGNRKAAGALRESSNNGDHAKDPNAPVSQVTARVEGTVGDDELKVEAIQIQ